MNAHTNPTSTAAAASDATAIPPAGALLGECPVWDEENGRLPWVDLWGGRLHATDPDTETTSTITRQASDAEGNSRTALDALVHAVRR